MSSPPAASGVAYFTTSLAVYDLVEKWMSYDAMLCLGLLRRQEEGAPLTLALLLSDDAGASGTFLRTWSTQRLSPRSRSLWEAVLASPRIARLVWAVGSPSLSESLVSTADLTDEGLPLLA